MAAWAAVTPRSENFKTLRNIQRCSRAEEKEHVCRSVARRFNIMTAPPPPSNASGVFDASLFLFSNRPRISESNTGIRKSVANAKSSGSNATTHRNNNSRGPTPLTNSRFSEGQTQFDDTQHPIQPQHDSGREPLRHHDFMRSQTGVAPFLTGKFLRPLTESRTHGCRCTTVANEHQYFCFCSRAERAK